MAAAPGAPGHDQQACEPFRKRVYTAAGAARDLLRLSARGRSIWRVWVKSELDPVLREQIMLAVAHANECRYCVVAHRSWALAVGVDERTVAELAGLDPDSVSPEARVELAWSLARLQAGFGPVEQELERALAERRTPTQRADLDTVVRVMTAANLAGNTFDALLSRLRGAVAPGSRLADELIVGGAFALLAIPVALTLSLRGGTKPLRLTRRLRRTR